ncbi:MAG: ATPase domain-containing protein [Candidatus Diapherotrites archaeon]
MEETKKARLLDSVKRLKEAGSKKEEVFQSLKDIGLNEKEAFELINKVFADELQERNDVNPLKENSASSVSETQKEKTVSKEIPEKHSFFEKIHLFKRKEKKEKKAEKNQKNSASEKPKEINFAEEGKTSENELKEKMPEISRQKSKQFNLFEKKEGISSGKVMFRQVLPVRVSSFDKLIQRGGLKRGDTILLSGGCGTGKTTFGMQSIYYGALSGERGVYITLEESTEKIRENMKENFGWNLEELEKKGLVAVISVDPLKIARSVEAALVQKRGGLYIESAEFDLSKQFSIPFTPDRVVFDSLSALSIAFQENDQGYRQYLRHLFATFESFGSINIMLGETEQVPGVYSRSGIEEFLADGVIVFYNIKLHNLRQKALEILKLRSSNHEKRIIPFSITDNGMEIYVDENLFKEVG